jgi:hypothetical protein
LRKKLAVANLIDKKLFKKYLRISGRAAVTAIWLSAVYWQADTAALTAAALTAARPHLLLTAFTCKISL